eukprot:jgi/Chlat1/6690/Chrsp49S00481
MEDYLNLAASAAVMKMLASYSAGNERVRFSDAVDKINSRGKVQRRVLMVTERAIYNLDKHRCKRRIPLQEIPVLMRSTMSGQFVLHVPSEYDYHYASARADEAVEAIATLRRVLTGSRPETILVDMADLRPMVTTKKSARRQQRTGGGAHAQGDSVVKGGDKGEKGEKGESVGGTDKGTQMSMSAASPSPEMCYTQGKEKVSKDDFELLRVLGKGSFGKVMLVRKKGTEGAHGIYAMKVLSKQHIAVKGQREHTLTERHILQASGAASVPGGAANAGCFDVDRARSYAAEMVLAVGHLHSLGIIYRDLKPENILLDAAGHIHLTDFGLAKGGIADNSSATTFCGTPEYLAPEILAGEGHGRAADWWSFGTLLYEMFHMTNGWRDRLVTQPPFYDTNMQSMYAKILRAPLHFPPFTPPAAIDILTKLLDRDPESRLGGGPDDAEDIKTHPFFEGVEWEAMMRMEVPAPFRPKIQSEEDVSNFDEGFTSEVPQDSYVESSHLAHHFEGFSYAPESALLMMPPAAQA